MRRRERLADAAEPERRVLEAPFAPVDGAGADVNARFEAARARGNEGLVVKRADSPYAPGRRGKWWLKLKRELATLDVAVVAVEWGHGKRAQVLSDYTFAVRDGERLLAIGKAYSGLTDAEIAELTPWFLEHRLPVEQRRPKARASEIRSSRRSYSKSRSTSSHAASCTKAVSRCAFRASFAFATKAARRDRHARSRPRNLRSDARPRIPDVILSGGAAFVILSGGAAFVILSGGAAFVIRTEARCAAVEGSSSISGPAFCCDKHVW